ncbi:hypothetical protein GWA97_08445 [Flavobacterium sp. LaA7.5]|nr:hypothetical protein [Flavobacterium salilacus subsp. altitudinum]
MREYLLLFRNISEGEGYVIKPEDMANEMENWQGWIGNIAMKGKLVATHPIEYKGTIVTNKAVSKGPDKDDNDVLVTGYLICKAESEAEVEEWSKTCPILKYPNGSVEIRPIVPFPVN